ncbi:MAG TPA: type II toxin-antitoxin system prevent-host-death family antitoxin [Gaiellaceae bacterium]|jgi:prevent-host-death family protein
MDKVNIHEAKTHLSRLIARVADGEEIVIGRAGKPVAKLVPYTDESEPRKLGGWKGKVRLARDWDSDELNEKIAATFRGE